MRIRWLLTALTVFSLLLCIAMTVLWVRSRRTLYGFEMGWPSGRTVLVCVRHGTVRLSFYSAENPAIRRAGGWDYMTFAEPTLGKNVMDIQGLYTDSYFERQSGVFGVEFWKDDERQIAFRLPCWFLMLMTALPPGWRILGSWRKRHRENVSF